MQVSYQIASGDFSHAGFASSEVKQMLKRLNIPPKIIKRVVIALYEAEVNITAHSYGGKVVCDITPSGITLTALDTGPGIPDISLAMSEGYSTASREVREMGFGAGMGLPNMRNNADEIRIESNGEEGTTIVMTIIIEKDVQP
jgi:anti-sigma regulatory factor (Ser/Thr protein kinase)